jgi:uncharacterized protein YndB with AHSA1/START domain
MSGIVDSSGRAWSCSMLSATWSFRADMTPSPSPTSWNALTSADPRSTSTTGTKTSCCATAWRRSLRRWRSPCSRNPPPIRLLLRPSGIRGEVLQADPPRLLQYTFAIGSSNKSSRVTIELVPETEATRVSVLHDRWAEDDDAYASSADGWPRILSRLKTLIETGKTFKPH